MLIVWPLIFVLTNQVVDGIGVASCTVDTACTGPNSGTGVACCTNDNSCRGQDSGSGVASCTGEGSCQGRGSGSGAASCTNVNSCRGTNSGSGKGSCTGAGSCSGNGSGNCDGCCTSPNSCSGNELGHQANVIPPRVIPRQPSSTVMSVVGSDRSSQKISLLFDMNRERQIREEIRFRYAEEMRQNMSRQMEQFRQEMSLVLNSANNSRQSETANYIDLHELELSKGFTSDDRVQINGKPTRMGFRISLMPNGTETIAFQMSVDFSKRCVSRSSYLNGNWSASERYGGFPFESDGNFTIVIRRDDFRFYVQVNGHDYCSFDHQFTEPDQIRLVRVEGFIHDLVINI